MREVGAQIGAPDMVPGQRPLPCPLGSGAAQRGDIPLALSCPCTTRRRTAPGKFPGSAAPLAVVKFPWLPSCGCEALGVAQSQRG